MDVVFKTRLLERCFERSAEATKKWGAQGRRSYIKVVSLIQISREFGDLRTVRSLRIHKLKGKERGLHAFDLHDRWRLTVRVKSERSIEIIEVSRHYGD